MIGLLCNDELYLVEKTPEMVELIQKHLKEVGTSAGEEMPEEYTQEWKDFNMKHFPATTYLEAILETLEPAPMPYTDALDMIARVSLEW